MVLPAVEATFLEEPEVEKKEEQEQESRTEQELPYQNKQYNFL